MIVCLTIAKRFINVKAVMQEILVKYSKVTPFTLSLYWSFVCRIIFRNALFLMSKIPTS